MSTAAQIFFICLVSGLLLVGAEIFLPGGVMGAVGAMALVAAAVMGFAAFPAYGPYITIGIVILVGVVIVAWIKLFPKSSVGRMMSVNTNLHDARGDQTGLSELVGKQGEALSALLPGGFARIDGKRVDVITEGRMLRKGTRLRVTQVAGNRVVVTEVPREQATDPEATVHSNNTTEPKTVT